MSPFSVGKLLPHIAKNHRGRTFLYFRMVLVEKSFWIIGVLQFCRILLSHITKKHRIANFFWIKGVSRLCRSYLSHSTENIRKRTFVFHKCSGIENFFDNKYHDSVDFFVSLYRKTSWANPSVFQKCSGIRIFLDSRGITFLSNFFLTSPKSSWVNHSVFQKNSSIKIF